MALRVLRASASTLEAEADDVHSTVPDGGAIFSGAHL